MKHNTSAYVECPFFHYYDSHKLCCEGVIKNSSIHLAFASPTSRREYMKSRCYENYKKCPIAKLLYEKYEEGEKS